MGIKQLAKLIKEKAGRAIVPRKFQYYSSSKIAIDASLSIYQFLISIRSDGANLGFGDSTTSHLSGIFYRTIRLVEAGIVPVYVFDGPAPAKKVHELKKRLERREKASRQLEEATLLGDKENMERHEKRKVKVEQGHIDDCKKLLTLMGIPHVTAVSEAEAYCAFLCREGCVQGVATEDMDALCFGAPLLLRNMNAAQSKKLDIDEYSLQTVLSGLGLSMDAFVDLCILMGCDYCETLKGVGPKRAYDYIKKYGTIENTLENEKLELPEAFEFKEARAIFNELSTIGEPQEFKIEYDNLSKAELLKYMVDEKGFDPVRIENGIDKIIGAKNRKNQLKLEAFFAKSAN